MNLSIHPDPQSAASACADHLLKVLGAAAQTKDRVSLAVSGGSTPKWMFQAMARSHFPWTKLHVFWVDERIVPPSDEQSNFRLAQDHWFTPCGFPPANIHRVLGEYTPEQAATSYAERLTMFFELRPGELPVFDAIHLGMGDDAHTASLFPGDPLTGNRTGIAAAVNAPKKPNWRVTLLPGVLRRASSIAMLVTGADKAKPLKLAVDTAFQPAQLPVQIIVKECPQAVWFLDDAAAEFVR